MDYYNKKTNKLGFVTGNNSCHLDSQSKVESLHSFYAQTGIIHDDSEQIIRHKRNTPPGN